MLTLETVNTGVTAALVAWVVSALWMAKPGAILHWWYLILDSLAYKHGGLVAAIAKPLGLCSVCTAGQVALWAGLAKFWMQYQQNIPQTLLAHLTAICVACFVAHLLTHTESR